MLICSKSNIQEVELRDKQYANNVMLAPLHKFTIMSSQQQRLVVEEARALHNKGYVVFPVDLWDDNGQKRAKFPNAWQKEATHVTCLSLFDSFQGFNGLGIKTGKESDIYVVDADVLKTKDAEEGLKDGVEILENKFQQNGESMEDYLMASTANKGKHLYFSYSKSDAAGLRQLGNTAKISVDGSKTTIDVRGEGGCVFAAPTSFAGKSYAWMSEVPRTEDLLPCPPWLIDILNRSGQQKRANAPAAAEDRRLAQRPATKGDQAASSRTDTTTLIIPEDMYQITRTNIEKAIGNTIKTVYPRNYGFDFHVVNPDNNCLCCLKARQHQHNAAQCRVVLLPCVTVRNYSTDCRSRIIAWDEVPVIKNLMDNPHSDMAFVELFKEQQKSNGIHWVWNAKESCFLRYEGIVYEQMVTEDIRQTIIQTMSPFLKKLVVHISYITAQLKDKQSPIRNQYNDETVKKELDGLTKAYTYIQKARSVDSLFKMAKDTLHDKQLCEKMDADPNLLGCKNGVINLETGELIINNPEMYVSRQAGVEYRGLDHPSPDIDAFLSSIFNADEDVIKYMQRLLGYGMTGLCREEVFVVFYGAGGNGKSLLNKLIKGVLGPYWSTMSRDCVFKSERRAGPGAPSPHLAMLKGLRIAVLDDCNEQEVLDDGTIKKMTSGVPMEARMLNQNPKVFTPTHLAIVCTNHLPKINVDDEAIERRLVLTPFANNYRAPDKFDPENPSHRPIDMTLGERLAAPEVLEQFLAWMARGAVSWYKEGLGAKPVALSAAQDDYYQENDVLGKFITDFCTTGPDSRVFISTFQTAFTNKTGQAPGRDFTSKMQKRGFPNKKLTIDRISNKGYVGIKLNEDL